MTDHELLELAAKAAGFVIFGSTPGRPGVDICGKTSGSKVKWWSPLTDDNDALALASKLRLRIDVSEGVTRADPVLAVASSVVEPHGNDPGAATRRAVVRAAAEIGKKIGQTS